MAQGEKGLAAARQRTADELAELLSYARSGSVPIGIEPIHPMKAADISSLTTLAEANELCDVLGDGLGIIIDCFHVWWDPSLSREIRRARGRIFGVHLCDWLVPFSENVSGRGMMGDGVIDIGTICEEIEGTGYRGFYEIELPESLAQPKDPASVVARCVKRYLSHT